MNKGFFITGTDTDCGKTWVALGVLRLISAKGYTTTVMKPVSAGCSLTTMGPVNHDAELLIQQADIKPDYVDVNPYAFEPAIAPHIAAARAGSHIDIGAIRQRFERLRQQADYIVVEGAGGWQVPLDDTLTMADLASALELPVIVVVAMKLGCLNHAILTVDSILRNDISVAGWVANCMVDGVSALDENIDTLKHKLAVPFLGKIGYLPALSVDTIARQLTGLELSLAQVN